MKVTEGQQLLVSDANVNVPQIVGQLQPSQIHHHCVNHRSR